MQRVTLNYEDPSPTLNPEAEIVLDVSAVSEFERRKQLYITWLGDDQQRQRLVERANNNKLSELEPIARVPIWQLAKNETNPAEGCIFFIENFCWTFDPRSEGKYLPVVLFDYQRDFIRYMIEHIDKGKNFLIEKSRDMGMSWLVCYVFLWYWLFREGSSLLMGSYKEDLVDDGVNINAIFGKLEFTLRNMPKWMMPRGFNFRKHRTHLKLVNPENGNIIVGDTMNPEFGRGARMTAIFYDELGFWAAAKEAWESGSQTTSCRIGNSTPHGKNYFWNLRGSGKYDLLTLHWKLHPLKDKEWYDYEVATNTDETVAQEIDLNYEKSLEGKVYPEWQPVEGHYPYNDNVPVYVGCDWGKEDGTAIIWAQLIDGKMRIIDSFYKTGETIDFFVPFFTGNIPSDHFRYNNKEIEKIERHRKWKRGTVYGDPAGRYTSAVTNQSVFSILKDNGIYVNWEERWKEFPTRKTAVKMRLRDGVELDKNDDNDYLSLCIGQAAYPRARVNGMDAVKAVKPNHDWTSHHRSALEYLCLGLENIKGSSVRVSDKFVRKDGKGFNPYLRRRVR